jgi:hypothetical protein
VPLLGAFGSAAAASSTAGATFRDVPASPRSLRRAAPRELIKSGMAKSFSGHHKNMVNEQQISRYENFRPIPVEFF